MLLEYTFKRKTSCLVAEVKKMKRNHQSSSSSQLKASLPPDLQRAMDLSMEKGASNWLTVLPVVDEFGFTLHKITFRDALALRYGWSLHQIPHTCRPVAQHSVWSMLYPVQKVDTPRYVIMA